VSGDAGESSSLHVNPIGSEHTSDFLEGPNREFEKSKRGAPSPRLRRCNQIASGKFPVVGAAQFSLNTSPPREDNARTAGFSSHGRHLRFNLAQFGAAATR
jgi:hypothetical protein